MTRTETTQAPARATLILATLILVAAVANLNLSVANVALPDIGRAFDASQTQLNLVAVAYSLGLAASVSIWGRSANARARTDAVLGMALSLPASAIAGFAGNFEILFLARVLGGVSAGLAFPTTLAIITALWSGPPRTKAITCGRRSVVRSPRSGRSCRARCSSTSIGARCSS